MFVESKNAQTQISSRNQNGRGAKEKGQRSDFVDPKKIEHARIANVSLPVNSV